jgi:hypothetical protein
MACDFIPFTVYDRYRLFPGAAFSGPAIVEERESTVIIGEDARAEVDEFGFLWIDLRQAAVPPASTENVGREVHELPERAANA